MVAPALQRRQSNSKGKQLQTGFFAFPVFICRLTSCRKRPSNPYTVLHLLWPHTRTILVSGLLQLRAPFSRPEGALLPELPLYTIYCMVPSLKHD